MRVIRQAGQAVEKLALLVQRAAQVDGRAFVFVGTGFQYHLVYRRFAGALADHIDDAARLVLAVKH